MSARTSPAYAPLPASIPAVLAPSSPLPPAFDTTALALGSALADTDKPRRRYGIPHAAPPGLGLPQLVSTAVTGRWGAPGAAGGIAPPWVLARTAKTKDDRTRDRDEQRAWDRLGVAGLPRDEEQAAEWDRIKRDWRADRDRSQVHEMVVVSKVGGDRRASAGRAGKATLAGHFTTSKPAVTVALSSKKRPPPSPPSAHSHSTSPPPATAAVATEPTKRANRPSDSPSFPSLSSINSAGQELVSSSSRPRHPQEPSPANGDARDELASGEDNGEVLFERGCTQILLPDPTPSHLPPSSRPPSLQPARPTAPFSSPGLRLSAPGVSVSTPHPARAAHLPSPSASPQAPSPARARSPPPRPRPRPAPPSRAQTQLSTLSAAPAGAAKPVLHRLSSIARTGSALSVRSSAAHSQGEDEGEQDGWEERFLQEDARD
ncbi:hypothetical protein JCM3770_002266 [Rhodotorula araucariae]